MTPGKFCFTISILVLLCMLPVSLRADTIYTYTGDAYNSCGGAYGSASHCNQAYTLHVTFDVAAGTNLDNLVINEGALGESGTSGSITSHITSFSFTDGSGINFNQSNAEGNFFNTGRTPRFTINIATDALGNITAWFLSACEQPPYQAGSSSAAEACEGSYWFPSYPQVYDSTTWSDGSNGGNCFDFGPGAATSSCMGTWTKQDTTTATPEPGTLTLLCSGMLGVVGGVRRKLRRMTRN